MVRQNIHNVAGTVVQGNVQVGGDFIGRDQYVGYSYQQVVALIATIRNADQQKQWNGHVPYVGLVPFEQEDSRLFAGREEISGTLLESLRTARFVAVAGASGSGKSSLVRAGVLSALSRGALPGSDKWLIETLTPRADPVEQLAQAMAALASRAGLSSAEGNIIREKGRTEPSVLSQVAGLIARGPRDQRVVLFIDQFEELYSQTKAAVQRDAFVKLITTAVLQPDGRVTIVIATRSDFLEECTRSDALRNLMNGRVQFVGAMERRELARAIAFPAMEVGVSIDPMLVEKMIDDTKGEPGALPLVQFALRDLFDAQPHKPGDTVSLTLADHLNRGGIGQALQGHAARVFAKFNSTQTEVARTIFSRLVDPGKGIRPVPTRRRAAEDDLIGSGFAQVDIAYVIDALVSARLITVEKETDGTNTSHTIFTLIHEQLIDAWPWLRMLVESNREAIAAQNQLGDDAQTWHSHNRDIAYVYVGERLQDVQTRLAKARLTATGLSHEFLLAGQTEQYKQERRAYLGQAAGIGIGCGMGYGIAFALIMLVAQWLAPQNVEQFARFVAFAFVSILPVGTMAGLSIGFVLWIARANTLQQCVGAGTAGTVTGALTYMAFAAAFYSPDTIGTPPFENYAAAGAVLGLSIGLGVAVSQARYRAWWVTPLLSIPSMLIANTFVPTITTNDNGTKLVTLAAAGLALGLLTALGRRATAVRFSNAAQQQKRQAATNMGSQQGDGHDSTNRS